MKKEDRIEQFIRENRPAFDRDGPSPALWSRIEAGLPEQGKSSGAKMVSLSFAIKLAAGVALILVFGVLLGVYIGQTGKGGYEGIVVEGTPYKEMEQNYSHMVNQRWEELSKYNYDPSIEKDISQLDAVYHELKAELLNASPENEEKIVGALIDNYRAKISILEKVLERMEKSDSNQNKEKNENIEI